MKSRGDANLPLNLFFKPMLSIKLLFSESSLASLCREYSVSNATAYRRAAQELRGKVPNIKYPTESPLEILAVQWLLQENDNLRIAADKPGDGNAKYRKAVILFKKILSRMSESDRQLVKANVEKSE